MNKGGTVNRLFLEKNRSDSGQGLVEYALILVLVGVVTILVLSLTGSSISNIYCDLVNTMGGECDSGSESDVVVIYRADYNSPAQSLHMDATSDGCYDPSVILTASPGGVMQERSGGCGHYHLDYSLPGCPCTVTITSSEGGTASVTVGP
jgi:pilus assembly protein Flp/PilA